MLWGLKVILSPFYEYIRNPEIVFTIQKPIKGKMITVRYESTIQNFFRHFVKPAEVGMRHLEVAFCKGNQEKLIELARERIIHRPLEANQDQYGKLSIPGRVMHLTLGLLETAGYVTLILPFIIHIVDRVFFMPKVPIFCGRLHNHIYEGGRVPLNIAESIDQELRRNPFSENGHLDLFYAGASWIPAAAATTAAANEEQEVREAPQQPHINVNEVEESETVLETTEIPLQPPQIVDEIEGSEAVQEEGQDPVATIMNTIMNPVYDAFNVWLGQQQELENVPAFVQQGANITQAFTQFQTQNSEIVGPAIVSFNQYLLEQPQQNAVYNRIMELRDARFALIAEERGIQIPA